MSETDKKESTPITDAIFVLLGYEKPDWIIAPLDEIKRIAKQNDIDVKDLNLTPIKMLEEK